MNQISLHKDFIVYQLTQPLAEKYTNQILPIWDQIPLTGKHTPQRLFVTEKDGRQMLNKWDHSLIALTSDEQLAGFVISYERAKENNQYFPKNSIYFKSFAIASKFQKQGLGKHLIQTWLDHNRKIGYLQLNGQLCFSVQTNSAAWNSHVQNLYTSFGFQLTATKKYPNRTDNIYFLCPPQQGSPSLPE